MRVRTRRVSAAIVSVAALGAAALGASACLRSTAEPGSAPEGVGELRPSEEVLRERLSPLEYEVTQEEGTEPAFENAYWDEKRPGIYVDAVSGEPLFSSTHKFESGTGWPSFTRPLEPENLYTRKDRSWGMVRTEVRSRGADSHLGHVFQDGPPPRGERWCINSAALRFVPASRLGEAGYGEYRSLFREGSGEEASEPAKGSGS